MKDVKYKSKQKREETETGAFHFDNVQKYQISKRKKIINKCILEFNYLLSCGAVAFHLFHFRFFFWQENKEDLLLHRMQWNLQVRK